MSKNRHLFELLLDHLKINDSDLLETLSRTELTKVEMLVQSRTWHFHLSLIHISEPTRRLRGSRMPSSA